MEELIVYFNKLKNVKAHLAWKFEDWSKCVDEINVLSKELNDFRIKDSKNAEFYRWVKGCLMNDMENEKGRIKILVGLREQMGKD